MEWERAGGYTTTPQTGCKGLQSIKKHLYESAPNNMGEGFLLGIDKPKPHRLLQTDAPPGTKTSMTTMARPTRAKSSKNLLMIWCRVKVKSGG